MSADNNFPLNSGSSNNLPAVGTGAIPRNPANKRARDDNDVEEPSLNTVGVSSTEKLRVLTGTAECIMKWHRLYSESLFYYELIATVVSIEQGEIPLKKILLMRDGVRGPIIKVIFYHTTYISLEDFVIGMKLRILGRMIGGNTMCAFKIREAQNDEIATLQRHCYIGDFTIKRILSEKNKSNPH